MLELNILMEDQNKNVWTEDVLFLLVEVLKEKILFVLKPNVDWAINKLE